MPRLPLCEMSPTGPVSVTELARNSSAPASVTPMQFGPSNRAPAARTFATIRAWRSRPASPSSPKPAVIATSIRLPAASASSTAASNEASGTARTTSSGGTGRSAREGYTR